INILEGAILEDAIGFGHLEEDDRPLLYRQAIAHGRNEIARIGDVFERHLAAQEIGLRLAVLRREIFRDQRDALGALDAFQPTGQRARIDTDAAVFTQLREEDEELTLAATDLHHFAPMQAVP